MSYNPSTLVDKTTTSTTGADVDATNLVITFTAPASGNVVVTLNGTGYLSVADYYHWCLRDTGGNNIAGQTQVVNDGPANDEARFTAKFYVTGLTGSVTYRWGFFVASGTGHLRYGQSGANLGPAVMHVQAAP